MNAGVASSAGDDRVWCDMDEVLAQRPQAPHVDPSRTPAGRASAALLLDAIRASEPVILVTGQFEGDASRLLGAALAGLGRGDPRVIRLSPPFPTARGVQQALQALQALLGAASVDGVAEPAEIAQSLLLLPGPAPGVAPVMIAVERVESAPEPLLRYLWLMHGLTSLGRVTLQLVLAGQDGGNSALAAPSLAGLRAAVSLRITAPLVSSALDLPSMGDVLTASLQRGDLAPLPLTGALGRPPVPATLRPHPGRRRAAAAGLAVCAMLAGFALWRLGVGQPVQVGHQAAVASPASTQSPHSPPTETWAMTPLQAGFELASLQQPPSAPLDRLLLSVRHPTPAVPEMPAAQAASPLPPLRSPSPPPLRSLPPLGPVVRVSAAMLPPALRKAAPEAAPSALLVLADATAPKVSVVFGLGDARGRAEAALAVERLRQSGLPVADAQAAARPLPHPGVGYFFAADRQAADVVAHSLAPVIGSDPVRPLPIPAELPPPGAIRVVIGSR